MKTTGLILLGVIDGLLIATALFMFYVAAVNIF